MVSQQPSAEPPAASRRFTGLSRNIAQTSNADGRAGGRHFRRRIHIGFTLSISAPNS